MYEYIHKKQRGYKYHCRGQERRNISFFTIQEQTITTVWVCVLRLRVRYLQVPFPVGIQKMEGNSTRFMLYKFALLMLNHLPDGQHMVTTDSPTDSFQTTRHTESTR